MENLCNAALSIGPSRPRHRARSPRQPRPIPPFFDNVLFKNLLQEESQNEEDPSLPVYSIEISRTRQCRSFRPSVVVKGRTFNGGQCFTRKAAEQSAAKEAYIYAKAVGFDPNS
ncbi:hypothetical protein AMTR_s00082p00061520 [Amborella trichopoda]|uniref:DRBM domain-containing protein n=1 Tax=Amborella trichopoda TaxID=13333 RepID=W1NSR9_AMBTC|nr:hypothetical protein AMTR_s00082p00061520 [Amborella trichopoda]